MSEKNKKTAVLSYAELGSFFENMAMMLNAGITAEEAVTLLAEETGEGNRRLHEALTAMMQVLQDGRTLEEAMTEAGAFPAYAVDMIRAAEYTGRLVDTMFHLSEYYRSEESMRKTLVSAVRYPVILLLMVIAVLTVMLTLVFPAFYGVYSNLTGSLGGSTFSYINGAFLVCRILLVVMIVLVLLLLGGVLLWRSGKKETVRKFLSRFKTLDGLIRGLDLYRFTSCFDMFLSSGEMRDEAVRRSMPVVESEELKGKLNVILEQMSQGKTFSQAAYDQKLFDHVNGRMLIPAERSGMLDSILQKILRSLKENNEAHISRIANTIEPLLTGLMMIFIGLMLISLMIPLIGIMNSIG